MKPSEECKEIGLKSLVEVSRISGESVQTLCNWHKNKPFIFKAVVVSAAVQKGLFHLENAIDDPPEINTRGD